MSSPTAQHPGVGERQGYIGGSDVAGILSLSPYSTPFLVFARKIGAEIAQANDPVREEKFYFGHLIEESIGRAVKERFNLPVERSPEPFYRHPKYQFMGAHVDFVCGSKTIVECKNIESEFAADWSQTPRPLEEDSSDLVPLYYLCQVDHYMAVMDRGVTYLAALFGGCRLRVYRINRSVEREQLIIAAETQFWQRVLRDDPPPFTGIDDLIAAIRSGYVQTYNAKAAKEAKARIELDPVSLKLIEEVAHEARIERKAHKARELARAALIARLQGRTGYLFAAESGKKVGSLLTGKGSIFDDFSFRLAHPEIAAQYTKEFVAGPTLRLAKDYTGDEEDAE